TSASRKLGWWCVSSASAKSVKAAKEVTAKASRNMPREFMRSTGKVVNASSSSSMMGGGSVFGLRFFNCCVDMDSFTRVFF
ncbi:hypothetical protein PC128_g26378, partial [Phytophthora cactorum]